MAALEWPESMHVDLFDNKTIITESRVYAISPMRVLICRQPDTVTTVNVLKDVKSGS